MIGVLLLACFLCSHAAEDLRLPSLYAEMRFRQQEEHGQSAPFNGDGSDTLSLLHRPVLDIYTRNLKVYGSVTAGAGAGGHAPPSCPNKCYHPMVASNDSSTVHYIENVVVTDQNGNVVAAGEIDAQEVEAKVEFEVPESATLLVPYVYCNKHGLWVGKSKSVTKGTKKGSDGQCVACLNKRSALTYESVQALLLNRQEQQFKRTTPFPPTNNTKDVLGLLHLPIVTQLGDGKAEVRVGRGNAKPPVSGCPNGCIHPMVPSNDSSTVHVLDYIYVHDQDGKVIAMEAVSPTEPQPATMTFDVPEGTTSLTAFTHCNKHGLYQGFTEKVTSTKSGYHGVTGKCCYYDEAGCPK